MYKTEKERERARQETRRIMREKGYPEWLTDVLIKAIDYDEEQRKGVPHVQT